MSDALSTPKVEPISAPERSGFYHWQHLSSRIGCSVALREIWAFRKVLQRVHEVCHGQCVIHITANTEKVLLLRTTGGLQKRSNRKKDKIY